MKKAAVTLQLSEPVTPGKYVLLFRGPVAEVEESFAAGLEAGGTLVIDKLLLPQVHPRVVAALEGTHGHFESGDSLGIVETHTIASTILAADTAVKRAAVKLLHVQLAKGIGGKGWFTLAGEQHDVEAALEGAAAAIEPQLLVATELIQRPHRDLKGPGLPP